MPKTVRNKSRVTTLAAETPGGDPENVRVLEAMRRAATNGRNWEDTIRAWKRSAKWRKRQHLPELPVSADPAVTLEAIPAALEENARNRDLFLVNVRDKIFQPSRKWPHGATPATGSLLETIKDASAAHAVHKAMLHLERNIGFRSVKVRDGKIVASKIVNSERRAGQALTKLAKVARKAKGPLDAAFYAAWLETPKSAKNCLIRASGDRPLMGYPFTPNPADILALLPRARELARKMPKESPKARNEALVALLRAYKAVYAVPAPLLSTNQRKDPFTSKTGRFVKDVCAHYAELIPNLADEFLPALLSKSTLEKLREQAEK